MHEGDRSFNCYICSNSFASKSNLNVHIKSVHEGKKSFRCNKDSCDAAFASNGELDRHVSSVHEKIKLFQCEICSVSFALKKDMKRHMKSVNERQTTLKCDKNNLWIFAVCQFYLGLQCHMVM